MSILENCVQKNEYQAQSIDSLLVIFEATDNKSISYYDNEQLRLQIAKSIAPILVALDSEVLTDKLDTIRKLYESGDFRFIADYLHALNTQNQDAIDAFETGENLEELSAKTHTMMADAGVPSSIQRVDNLDAVFDGDDNAAKLFLADPQSAAQIETILSAYGEQLPALIEAQYDLPGVNSLVRKGLVKSFEFNDQSYVTKRDNPEKKGRFLTEQQNLRDLYSVFGLQKTSDTMDVNGLKVRIIRPIAVFSNPQSGSFYSIAELQEGPTLEEKMLKTADADERTQTLVDVRKILEFMYENGVLWGDMAPRNIICADEDGIDYYLLDFEKTKIVSHPATPEERFEHCRGPMCVEEFGAICTREEVEQCFAGYFDPQSWDTASTDAVPFTKPKRELIAIFDAQGVTDPTFGEYNKLEHEVIGVRFPFAGRDENYRYPLNASFKIDHYLGADYDRKATELFMAAKSVGLLEDALDVVETSLQQLDNRLIISDFDTILSGERKLDTSKDSNELDVLRNLIDDLHTAGNDPVLLKKTLNKYSITLGFHSNLVNGQSGNGIAIATSNASTVKPSIEEFAAHIQSQYGESVSVFFSGGYARNELTAGSDLDIGVISADSNTFAEVRKQATDYFSSNVGLDVEFYPDVEPSRLAENLSRCPQYFIDYYNAEYGQDNANSQQTDAVIGDLCSSPEFVADALMTHLLVRSDLDEIPDDKKAKAALNDINMIVALFDLLGMPETEDHRYLAQAKSILLYQKNRSAYDVQVPEQIVELASEAAQVADKAFEKITTTLARTLNVDWYNSREKTSLVNSVLSNQDGHALSEQFDGLDEDQSNDFMVLASFIVNPATPEAIKNRILELSKDDPWLADLAVIRDKAIFRPDFRVSIQKPQSNGPIEDLTP